MDFFALIHRAERAMTFLAWAKVAQAKNVDFVHTSQNVRTFCPTGDMKY